MRERGYHIQHDEMEVVRHQAERMNPATKLFDCILKKQIETIPVEIIAKDRISGIAA